jgi:outer membrane protein assembly factor BamB
VIDAKWKELSEQYEKDKLKDPDFAIPPNEDALPKVMPRKLWQAGNEKWHVDSAVAVVGENLLAASAALEVERTGDRALFCLNAADGQVKWRAPLALNPWGGPTVADNAILLGCSSIRFDPKEIPGRGEVVAINPDTGAVMWRKQYPGGIVSAVAAAGGLAIFTAADGKVRALSIADGQEKWTYDARAPLFAGPAVGAASAYAADLKGRVHSLRLADGKPNWVLDLATDPAVSAPGSVYGSPVLHQGRLYVATSNLEAGADQQKTVVVCIGDK